jgi:hypothetical protein
MDGDNMGKGLGRSKATLGPLLKSTVKGWWPTSGTLNRTKCQGRRHADCDYLLVEAFPTSASPLNPRVLPILRLVFQTIIVNEK